MLHVQGSAYRLESHHSDPSRLKSGQAGIPRSQDISQGPLEEVVTEEPISDAENYLFIALYKFGSTRHREGLEATDLPNIIYHDSACIDS